MKLTPQQMIDLLNFELFTESVCLEIHPIDALPRTLPPYTFPIVDRKLGMVLFTKGIHDIITTSLGQLHQMLNQGEEGLLQQALTNIEEDVAKGIPRHSSVICHSPIYSIEADERCISVFMENGYYWSSAQVIPALVLLKRYVFDSIDRTIIRKYKMPTDDKRYPFDRFDH